MKHILKLTTIIMIFIMVMMIPLEVFATTDGVKYVSEIVTVAATSETDAENQFKDKGYKMVTHSNLNKTLKTGVYLGYKETDKKEEALTDIAAMNMYGNYSFSKAKEIINDQKAEIKKYVLNIEKIIKNYQLCFNKGKVGFDIIYEALNKFVNDDDKDNIIKMGQYFKEYDFSEAQREELTNMLMQANSVLVSKMFFIMSMVGDARDVNFFEILAQNNTEKISEKFSDCFTEREREEKMVREYGEVSEKLGKTWDESYTRLSYIKEHVSTDPETKELVIDEKALKTTETDFDTSKMSDTAKTLFETVNNMDAIGESVCSMVDFVLYKYLTEHKMGDGKAMIDFFCRPLIEVEKEELYVIVDSMSEGQKAQAGIIGIMEILENTLPDNDTKNISKEKWNLDKVSLREIIETVENISIFFGVDRSIFEDGVAYTDKVTENDTISNREFYKKMMIGFGVGTLFSILVDGLLIRGITTNNKQLALLRETMNYEHEIALGYATMKGEVWYYWEEHDDAFLFEGELWHYWSKNNDTLQLEDAIYMKDILDRKALEHEAESLSNKREIKKLDDCNKCCKGFLVFSLLITAVCLLITIVSIVKYFKLAKPVETKIPHHMMTKNEDGELVFYNSVKTLGGEISDINNHESKIDKEEGGWLVLYTTRNPDAGKPILAGSIKVIDSSNDIGKGEVVMHPFNGNGGLNTVAPLYTGKDTNQQTYIVYKEASKAV